MVKEFRNIQKQHQQHSKKYTPQTSRSTLATLQHGKIMAQHQLMLRATWSSISQYSKATSATLKNNICNIEI
jgi:hypothetical protein